MGHKTSKLLIEKASIFHKVFGTVYLIQIGRAKAFMRGHSKSQLEAAENIRDHTFIKNHTSCLQGFY